MNYSSNRMSSAERRSQSNPLQIQNHETRGESSNQIHERISTQIQPQSISVSVSEGDQTSRTVRQSALGKRSSSDMLVSPNTQIIMPVDERMNVMRPTMETSSEGRNLLTSMSVPEQQLPQPFQAITSQQPFQMINVADLVNDVSGRDNTHTPSSVMNQIPNQAAIIPSGMSERHQQLPQPMQAQTSQEALEMSRPRHDSYYNMFQQDSGQPAYPGNQRVNPADIAGSSRRTFHLPPLSARAKQEIVNKFQAWRAAQGLMLEDNDDPSSQRAIIAHQPPTQQADDPLIGRFSSLIAVTQRHGLDKKGKQSMSDQVPQRGMVLGRTDPLLVAWPLHHSSTTDQMMMRYPISSAPTLKTIQYITGEGTSEARKTLELMSTAGEGMHECRVVYGDGREGISCFTLPTKDQVNGFTKQFSALMAREGFRLADPQFDDFVEMVEQRLSRLENSQSRQQDKTASHANAQGMMAAEPSSSQWHPKPLGHQMGRPRAAVNPQVGRSLSQGSSTTNRIPTQADPHYPYLLTIAGNPDMRVPILIPYAARIQRVPAALREPAGMPLAEPIRLPPIPSDVVVPVKTPCIIPMRAAAKLISQASANESNSSQLILQQLPWILDNVD